MTENNDPATAASPPSFSHPRSVSKLPEMPLFPTINRLLCYKPSRSINQTPNCRATSSFNYSEMFAGIASLLSKTHGALLQADDTIGSGCRVGASRLSFAWGKLHIPAGVHCNQEYPRWRHVHCYCHRILKVFRRLYVMSTNKVRRREAVLTRYNRLTGTAGLQVEVFVLFLYRSGASNRKSFN